MKASELQEAQELIEDRKQAIGLLTNLRDGHQVQISTPSNFYLLTLETGERLGDAVRCAINDLIIDMEARLADLGITEFDTDDVEEDEVDENEEAA